MNNNKSHSSSCKGKSSSRDTTTNTSASTSTTTSANNTVVNVNVGEIGYTLKKYFPGHGVYDGVVIDIRLGAMGGKDRRVLYTDGDSEDMDMKTLETLEPSEMTMDSILTMIEEQQQQQEQQKQKKQKQKKQKAKKKKQNKRPLSSSSSSSSKSTSSVVKRKNTTTTTTATKSKDPRDIFEYYMNHVPIDEAAEATLVLKRPRSSGNDKTISSHNKKSKSLNHISNSQNNNDKSKTNYSNNNNVKDNYYTNNEKDKSDENNNNDDDDEEEDYLDDTWITKAAKELAAKSTTSSTHKTSSKTTNTTNTTTINKHNNNNNNRSSLVDHDDKERETQNSSSSSLSYTNYTNLRDIEKGHRYGLKVFHEKDPKRKVGEVIVDNNGWIEANINNKMVRDRLNAFFLASSTSTADNDDSNSTATNNNNNKKKKKKNLTCKTNQQEQQKKVKNKSDMKKISPQCRKRSFSTTSSSTTTTTTTTTPSSSSKDCTTTTSTTTGSPTSSSSSSSSDISSYCVFYWICSMCTSQNTFFNTKCILCNFPKTQSCFNSVLLDIAITAVKSTCGGNLSLHNNNINNNMLTTTTTTTTSMTPSIFDIVNSPITIEDVQARIPLEERACIPKFLLAYLMDIYYNNEHCDLSSSTLSTSRASLHQQLYSSTTTSLSPSHSSIFPILRTNYTSLMLSTENFFPNTLPLSILFTWTCEKCTVRNSYKLFKCALCKHPKTLTSKLSTLLQIAMKATNESLNVDDALRKILPNHKPCIPRHVLASLITCSKILVSRNGIEQRKCQRSNIPGLNVCKLHCERGLLQELSRSFSSASGASSVGDDASCVMICDSSTTSPSSISSPPWGHRRKMIHNKQNNNDSPLSHHQSKKELISSSSPSSTTTTKTQSPVKIPTSNNTSNNTNNNNNTKSSSSSSSSSYLVLNNSKSYFRDLEKKKNTKNVSINPYPRRDWKITNIEDCTLCQSEHVPFPIGLIVRRFFPGYGFHDGTIISISRQFVKHSPTNKEDENRPVLLYRVKYLDGDEEDFMSHEISSLRQMYTDIQCIKSTEAPSTQIPIGTVYKCHNDIYVKVIQHKTPSTVAVGGVTRETINRDEGGIVVVNMFEGYEDYINKQLQQQQQGGKVMELNLIQLQLNVIRKLDSPSSPSTTSTSTLRHPCLEWPDGWTPPPIIQQDEKKEEKRRSNNNKSRIISMTKATSTSPLSSSDLIEQTSQLEEEEEQEQEEIKEAVLSPCVLLTREKLDTSNNIVRKQQFHNSNNIEETFCIEGSGCDVELNGIDSIRHSTSYPHAHNNDNKKEKLWDPANINNHHIWDPYNLVTCEICHVDCDDHQMLICDQCGLGFHMYCVRPIIVNIPTEDWFCRECSKANHPNIPKVKPFEEIQNDLTHGEIMRFLNLSDLFQQQQQQEQEQEQQQGGERKEKKDNNGNKESKDDSVNNSSSSSSSSCLSNFLKLHKKELDLFHMPTTHISKRYAIIGKRELSRSTLKVGNLYFSSHPDKNDWRLPPPLYNTELYETSLRSWVAAMQHCGMTGYTEDLLYDEPPSPSLCNNTSSSSSTTTTSNTTACSTPLVATEEMNDASKDIVEPMSKRNLSIFWEFKENLKRGAFPPIKVVFDERIGFTVVALARLQRHTLIAEYVGEVTTVEKSGESCSDSLMMLLDTGDPKTSLIIDPSKKGNIARFLSGINNLCHTSKRKANVRTRRFATQDGKCHIALFTAKKVEAGDQLYYDYNAGLGGKEVNEWAKRGFYDTRNFF